MSNETHSEISQVLLVESYESANTYFQLFNEKLLPAIRSGQLERAHDIFHTEMTDAYLSHRAAIDHIVSLQKAAINQHGAETTRQLTRSWNIFIFLSIFTTGMVVIFGYFISRLITTPIVQLTQVAAQITSGNLVARAPANTTEEVGTLASAFNQMSTQLQELIGSLEQRVAQRTQALTTSAIESLLFRTGQELAMEIQLITRGTLGLISGVVPPKAFPMRGLRARQFAAKRTILTGETAHAFPPVGAQGLNISLRDVGHAVDVVLAHDDAGSPQAMADYHGRRTRDVTERQAMISAMNTSMLAEFLPLDLMRVGALSAISAFPPLRQMVMRQGLAPSSNLPYAMR